MSKVVGIDLGTTNSLVAFVGKDGPVVIRDGGGDALVPSIVSIDAAGAVFVGREAERRLLTDPLRTVYSVKRLMGRGAEDVRGEAALFPFRLSGEAGGVVRVGLGDREVTPPEISAFILRELKRRAEEHFLEQGEFDPEVDRAVITVPAYFNDAQRTATRDAGRIAGLEVLRIINEPTAASLAYGLDQRKSGTIAVYDFGGGTFDISILRVEDGVFQVLATNGDTHLGGDDIDQLLVALVLGESDLGRFADPARFQAVRRAVIQAKWDLSEREETVIRVADPAAPGSAVPLFERRLSRDEFERLVRPVVERTLEPCRLALADAGLDASRIDEAVLVGGSTRIPLVRRSVRELFGREPHAELNPDEVVAIGAAIQAHIMISGSRDMLLLDVTPLSLGIETMGGAMSKIILRNSTIPASGTEMFTTFVDNQTAVDIHVLQGERELVGDNRSLARFKLRGIPPMPAGLPRIQVRFQIDAERHPERRRARAAHRDRADDRGEAVLRPDRRGSRADAARVVRARRGGRRGAHPDRAPQRGRDGDSRDREVAAESRLRDGEERPRARRAGGDRVGAGRPAIRDGVGRPRRSRGQDQGAQRRDAAPGRGDDEPRRPRGAGGEERRRRVTGFGS